MSVLVTAATLSEARQHAGDIELAGRMCDALMQAYPGYAWAVNCNHATQLADIRCLNLAGDWGYTLRMGEQFSWTDWAKKTLAGGGEILERFRAARRGLNEDQLLAATAPLRDFARRLRPDL